MEDKEKAAFEKACGQVGKYEITDDDLLNVWKAAVEWARTQQESGYSEVVQ